MASRLLGVARESIFSRLFGANWLTDAYIVAFRIPNLMRDLFAEGALSSAFVPTFAEALHKEGKQQAFRLGNLIFTGVLLVTGLISIAGIVFAGEISSAMAAGFRGHTESYVVARWLARLMMPMLTVVSLSAVLMGMLNAQKTYGPPALAPALFNLASIVVGGGIFVAGLGGERAITVWALGTLLGAVAQGAWQVPALWRQGWRPALTFAGLATNPAVRRVLRLMLPAVLGMAAAQLNIFINTYFALSLGAGPQTHLTYAFRLFYLPIGLFGVALGTVTTSRVADEAARGDLGALARRSSDGAMAVWLLALPSAIGLVLLAEPIVVLLYQGLAFTAADTAATVPVVRAYMLGVVPYSLVKVYAPAFYSLDRSRVPMFASLAAVAGNVLWNALTHETFGAAGIAFGTTLAALVNFAVLRAAFRGLVRGQGEVPGRGRQTLALLVGNVLLGGLVLGAWWAAERGLAALPAGFARAAQPIALFGTIGLGLAVYVTVMRRLGYPGAEELAGLGRRVLGKLTGGR
jgi:putative peptidoglycan lipid II flippase